MRTSMSIAAAAIFLAACGQSDQRPPDIDVDQGAEVTIKEDSLDNRAVIQLARKGAIGQYLADREGRSLYVLEADTQGSAGSAPVSACTGPCTEQWPPVVSTNKPKYAPGVKGEMLSTFAREDGTKQVSYNGYPLYHFYRDQQPGYTEGQAMQDTWGHWYLLSPTGQMIEIDMD